MTKTMPAWTIAACIALAAALGQAAPAAADGCYLCEGGGYVRYVGEDTWDLRRKAQASGCKVTGTTGSCTNPKALVADPARLEKRPGTKSD